MITDPQGTILALFLVFCRIGACFMALPGFSSARLNMQIRLFVAVAVSMALAPILWDIVYPRASVPGATYIAFVVAETLIGTMYGLIARFYVLGLQFTGSVLTSSIGFNAPGGGDIVEDSPENTLTNLITFSGLMLLFMLDFHHIVFKALVESYSTTPVGIFADPQKMLITLTDTLRASTMIMLRLASPFLLYGLMFNVSIGLINKLAPQIPVYFISTPFLLAGGLFMVYLSIAALIRQFADNFIPVFVGF